MRRLVLEIVGGVLLVVLLYLTIGQAHAVIFGLTILAILVMMQ